MGGRAPDGKMYYGEQFSDGEEWYPPAEPLDVEEVPLPPDDVPVPQTEPYEETVGSNRYSGVVNGVDYGNSERPGCDPYRQTHGKLTPIQIACPPPESKGCGAPVNSKCTFSVDRAKGVKSQEHVEGTRKMPCVIRIRLADQS